MEYKGKKYKYLDQMFLKECEAQILTWIWEDGTIEAGLVVINGYTCDLNV